MAQEKSAGAGEVVPDYLDRVDELNDTFVTCVGRVLALLERIREEMHTLVWQQAMRAECARVRGLLPVLESEPAPPLLAAVRGEVLRAHRQIAEAAGKIEAFLDAGVGSRSGAPAYDVRLDAALAKIDVGLGLFDDVEEMMSRVRQEAAQKSARGPRASPCHEDQVKTLLILRHAKAQPDAPAGDWARDLTDRGRRDAAVIGAYIHTLIGCPDAIVTSDARRALHTAELVATAVGFVGPLTVVPQVYDAEPSTLLALVRSLPNAINTVLLVGHNPELEELAEGLVQENGEAVCLPTAGLAHIEFNEAGWEFLWEGIARWRGVATPRSIA